MDPSPTDTELLDCLTGPAADALPHADWLRIARSLDLSEREFRVVIGICNDDKRFKIARDLGISPHTLSPLISCLYAKMHVTGRVELVMKILNTHATLLAARARAADSGAPNPPGSRAPD